MRKSQTTAREALEQIADQFVMRLRRGERPSVDEFVRRYPEQADEIREVFPALVLLERAGGPGPPAIERHEGLRRIGGEDRRFGAYRIIREIGRGGMGVVFQAEHVPLQRTVALKVLAIPAADARALKRFEREARLAAGLHHTNIVPVFESGEINGAHYIAMQLITGRSLQDLLAELKQPRSAPRPGIPAAETMPAAPAATEPMPTALRRLRRSDKMPFQTAARIAARLAEALAYAHEKGVLHRDIKPSNLLLDESGTPWVTDFGLAKVDGDSLTHSGDVIGTLRYMSPERFHGECDVRTDVYGLGVTLYEMLTLQPAFSGEDRVQLIQQVLQHQPPRPRSIDPRIPAELEAIVLKAMARFPADRYPSAQALADDLQRFLEHRPIRARSPSHLERAVRWCRRKPAIAALLCTVCVLAAALIAGGWIAAFTWRTQRNSAEAGWAAASRAHRQSVAAKQRAQVSLYRSLIERSRALRLSGRAGQRTGSLAALRDAAELQRTLALPESDRLGLRNEVIAALALADLEQQPVRSGVAHDRWQVAFDAGLQRYAFCHSGPVVVREMASGKELARLDADGQGTAAVCEFSRCGRFLALLRTGRKLQIWDVDRLRLIHQGPAAAAVRAPHPWAFDAASRAVAVADGDDQVILFDLLSGAERTRFEPAATPHMLAFGGPHLLALSSGGNSVDIWDVTEPQHLHTLKHSGPVQAIAWNDSTTLLATAADHLVHLWEWPGGARRGVVYHDDPLQIQFQPGTDRLASFGLDRSLRIWHASTAELLVQADAVQLSRQTFAGVNLPYRVGNDGFGALQIAASDVFNELRAHRGWTHDLHISSDASFLATCSLNQGVRVWRLDTLERLAEVSHEGCRGVRFSPDGNGLYTSGGESLLFWPVEEREGTLVLGPPRTLHRSRREILGRLALSADGGRLAVITASSHPRGRILLFDVRQQPPKRLWTAAQPNVQMLALSSDGLRLAGGSWNGYFVGLWDVSQREELHRLPVDGTPWLPATRTCVAFSPDGERLVAGSTSEYLVWKLPSAALQATIPRERLVDRPGPAAFSPDGRLLATCLTPQTVQLLDGTTLEELATLAAPHPKHINVLRFSPDGTKLFAATRKGAVQQWDLQRIRSRLAELHLDWEHPPLAVAARSRRP